ncbi:MAG TPA: ATP-binding cassette domain-containing protein, partial [Coxiellaceae bacterium]|nr:ATP-binding cassette domain-containing protein [Coxiellaceae bacterium]
ILGASGAGKSTLLQIIGGLDKPTQGEVWWGDQPIVQLSDAALSLRRNYALGFIYQFHHLLPEFNALENVAMPLLIRKLSIAEAMDRAKVMLEEVGLGHRLTHRPSELSGGERQRVAIARALVTKPHCVLADEPTGNLDPETAQTIAQLMLRLNQHHRISFVIVTHNQTLAQQMDRVLVLEKSQLR